MEATKEPESGLLHRILPPRLEDAGLEDCALPPESIKEAFSKAATAVKSRAASFFTSEDEGGCVSDPWPTPKEGSDKVVGVLPEKDPPGHCGNEKGGGLTEVGGDHLRIGGGGVGKENGVKVVLGGEDKPCVDELHGLDIEDQVKNGSDDEMQETVGEGPTLAEGFA